MIVLDASQELEQEPVLAPDELIAILREHAEDSAAASLHNAIYAEQTLGYVGQLETAILTQQPDEVEGVVITWQQTFIPLAGHVSLESK